MRRGVGRNEPSVQRERGGPIQVRQGAFERGVSLQAQAESRALIARFFIDLRQALRLTVPQAAHHLSVHPEVVEALETGQVEFLPHWSEMSAIIMTYTSMAGVNGRPVLHAIGTLLTHLSVPAAPPAQITSQRAAPESWPPAQNQMPRIARRPSGFPPSGYPQQAPSNYGQQGYRQVGRAEDADLDYADLPARSGLAASSRNLLRAASAIANGARRLPQEAFNQVRRRPQRALYALSLPLGLLLIMMHSSIVATVSNPFGRAVQWVSTYIQEHYGPVRDGLRYIEVDDPRSRRGDKLQIGSGSY